MQRRTAWRHWGLTTTAQGLALVTIATIHAAPDSVWWPAGLIGLVYVAAITSMVINRPRPQMPDPRPVPADHEGRAAVKAVRRGISVELPTQQRRAIDAVRREWFTTGLQCGIFGGLAATFTWQGSTSGSDMLELGLEILGYLMLLVTLAQTAYYGLVLRRLDTLDTHEDDQPSAKSKS